MAMKSTRPSPRYPAGGTSSRRPRFTRPSSRLEDAGYITSYWGEQGAGARRKYYAITARGVDACRRMAEEWEEAREIIDQLLKRGEKDHA